LLTRLKLENYNHVTVSPATHEIVNKKTVNDISKSLVDIFGWSRPFLEKNINEGIFKYMRNANILEPHGNLWISKIRVSTLYGMYFIHSAFPTLDEKSIFFGPDTYRFIRTLNEYLTRNTKPIFRAVDICTGCGPAALFLANKLGTSEIIGVDINESALEYANFNANVNKITNAKFVYSDLLKNIEGKFDFITANPPYMVDKSKRSYRHGGGIYGFQLSLDIVKSSIKRLNPGGALLLYTGVVIIKGKDLFREEVTKLLSDKKLNFEYEEIDPDIFSEELTSEFYINAERIAAVALKVNMPIS
jgi:methylase of polypeptide subunit release factors